jgi:repressor LexA
MPNDRTQEILRLITEFTEKNGYMPTIREIGDMASISSTNGVRYHLNLLETAGLIQRDKKRSRAIVLPKSSRPRRALPVGGAETESGIPILGRVAAGLPIEAQEDVLGHVSMDEMFPARGDLFALKVQGESMKDRGILNGDVVVVRKQEYAREGDAVVALVDGGDATVKTYRRTEDAIELVPENPEFAVRRIERDEEMHIVGVVVGLVRPMGITRRS